MSLCHALPSHALPQMIPVLLALRIYAKTGARRPGIPGRWTARGRQAATQRDSGPCTL
ncbi:hypothetical protein GCM10010245_69300 [Streptomyces spectabilis]|nr:hypothetical protein GCM10010245_69300 [Streptomyces spectabilis]